MRLLLEGIVRNNHVFQNKMSFYSKYWNEIYFNLKKKKLINEPSGKIVLFNIFKGMF